MKKSVLQMFAFTMIVGLSVSCSKSSNTSSSSRHDLLIGSWNLTQYGYDANNNGVWDANEIIYASASDQLMLTFLTNGNVIRAETKTGGIITSATLGWQLINNDQYMNVVDATAVTYVYHFDAFSASSMILRYTDTSGAINWGRYAKQ